MATRFIFPICAINAAQASESGSSPKKSATTSLTTKRGELGDSEGERRRMERVDGIKDVVRVKICWRGLSLSDGIECVRVGDKVVGWSYLDRDQWWGWWMSYHTHLTHMMKILCTFTGMLCPLKISANRSNPRPLLVVHSGNTTIGWSAWWHMCSKLSNFVFESAEYGGTCPVKFTMDNNDTLRNPSTGIRALAALFGEGILAEPVFVRPPVLWTVAVDFWDDNEVFSTVPQTGSTNIGLKLDRNEFRKKEKRKQPQNSIYTGKLAIKPRSMKLISNYALSPG